MPDSELVRLQQSVWMIGHAPLVPLHRMKSLPQLRGLVPDLGHAQDQFTQSLWAWIEVIVHRPVDGKVVWRHLA